MLFTTKARSLAGSLLALVAAGACSPGGASSPPVAREVSARAEAPAGEEPGPVPADPPLAPATAPGPATPDDDRAAAIELASGASPTELERHGPCWLRAVGLRGECMATAACASLGGHMSTPGYCPGPSTIACCTAEPAVDEHPRPPAGWMPLPQERVTTQMTAWALMIVGTPGAYPMGAMAKERFGPVEVMARVEWHPPDLGHGVVHRGVTLYQPG